MWNYLLLKYVPIAQAELLYCCLSNEEVTLEACLQNASRKVDPFEATAFSTKECRCSLIWKSDLVSSMIPIFEED